MKVCLTCTMKHNSGVNKNGILNFAGKWNEARKIILSEITETKFPQKISFSGLPSSKSTDLSTQY